MKTIVLVFLVLFGAHSAVAGPVLDRVHAAKSLSCGVIKEEEDYSRATDHGNRAAFDLDMCKAIAVATLGAGAHFTISVFPDEPAGVKALREDHIDLLPSASPTVANTVGGLSFGPITLYDGEGLMIANTTADAKAIWDPKDLAGKKICFVITSASETGLREFAAREKITYIWFPFSEVGEMEAAFFTGNCAGLAGDVTQLANTRAINRGQAGNYTILPQIIRKDPLAPAYASGDAQFANVVHWTVETLVEAEELGVTQGSVKAMQSGSSEKIQQLLGQHFGTGARLGLDDHWGANVIQAVGNYGEMFDRDLGANSPLRLDRGANRLWTEGGLMYAEAFGNQ